MNRRFLFVPFFILMLPFVLLGVTVDITERVIVGGYRMGRGAATDFVESL